MIRRWNTPRPPDPVEPRRPQMPPQRRPPEEALRAARRLADPNNAAGFAAYLRSCEPAWTAAQYGDRDPQVLAQAAAYQRFWILGGDHDAS